MSTRPYRPETPFGKLLGVFAGAAGRSNVGEPAPKKHGKRPESPLSACTPCGASERMQKAQEAVGGSISFIRKPPRVKAPSPLAKKSARGAR